VGYLLFRLLFAFCFAFAFCFSGKQSVLLFRVRFIPDPLFQNMINFLISLWSVWIRFGLFPGCFSIGFEFFLYYFWIIFRLALNCFRIIFRLALNCFRISFRIVFCFRFLFSFFPLEIEVCI